MAMNNSRKIAENLLKHKAVRVSIDPPFTWVSGIKSPIYCDNRMMISFPNARKTIVEAFKQMIEEKGLKPDVIGGTATAAIPWAAFLAYELGLPMIYIRPEPKGHGAGKQIEGSLEPHQNVLIVEDLVSTGGSSVKAAEAVRNEGKCTVTDIFAIVTYELAKADANFEGTGIELSTLTNFSEIIAAAADNATIPQDRIDLVLEFRKDPDSWATKMGI